jgi:hypothetical protein
LKTIYITSSYLIEELCSLLNNLKVISVLLSSNYKWKDLLNHYVNYLKIMMRRIYKLHRDLSRVVLYWIVRMNNQLEVVKTLLRVWYKRWILIKMKNIKVKMYYLVRIKDQLNSISYMNTVLRYLEMSLNH